MPEPESWPVRALGLVYKWGGMGVAAMVGAALLWGLSGALIARLQTGGVTVAAIVSFAAGATLLGLGRVRGESWEDALRSVGWWLPVLGVLEAANSWLYYAALHLAPIGVVISLHLCSPVLLLLTQLVLRQRRLGVREVTSLASLTAALATIGLANPASPGRPHPVLGAILSLASAAILAVFIGLVSQLARHGPTLSRAGAQMTCSGLLLAPALFVVGPVRSELPALGMIGIVVFAPAVALYWKAAGSIRPVLVTTIQLLEPVSATAASVVLFGVVPTPLQLLAACLTLCATWVEAARGPSPSRSS